MYLTVFSSQYDSFPINNIYLLLYYHTYIIIMMLNVCFEGPHILL